MGIERTCLIVTKACGGPCPSCGVSCQRNVTPGEARRLYSSSALLPGGDRSVLDTRDAVINRVDPALDPRAFEQHQCMLVDLKLNFAQEERSEGLEGRLLSVVGKQGPEMVLEARRCSEEPGTERCAGLSWLGASASLQPTRVPGKP